MLRPRIFGEGIKKRPEICKTTEPPPKEKIRINLRPFKTVFYLALIVAVLYLVFFSGIFKIKNVEIEGVKSVEISDYLQRTLVGKNILLLRPGAYLDELSGKFPILDEAKIVRGLPSTVKITISEKRQVLIWCSGDKCFEVDSQGYAYQETARPQDKIAIVDQMSTKYKVGDKIVSPEFISFFLSALDGIEANGLKVGEAQIGETTFKLSFKTGDGWLIILDPTESLKDQMSALKQVLEKNRADIKEYVDLRVEGLAYIK